MKRFHEELQSLVVGQQYVCDPQGTGVGMIVDDGGVKCLDMHPAYPGRNPLYLPMKYLGRQPSCDLSSSTLQGQALNHELVFRVYKNTAASGIVMDSMAAIAPGTGSRIRLGHDGTRWYVYVCVPWAGITPSTEFSLVKPLDNGWHNFKMAIRHNRIVGELDGSQFMIPYVVDKAYNTPDALVWTVVLCSTSQFSVRYRDMDFAIQN